MGQTRNGEKDELLSYLEMEPLSFIDRRRHLGHASHVAMYSHVRPTEAKAYHKFALLALGTLEAGFMEHLRREITFIFRRGSSTRIYFQTRRRFVSGIARHGRARWRGATRTSSCQERLDNDDDGCVNTLRFVGLPIKPQESSQE